VPSMGLLRELPAVYEDLRQAARDQAPVEEMRLKVGKALGIEEQAAEEEQKTTDTGVDAAAIVRWQYERHDGHVASFASTVQRGPLQGQHSIWKDACAVLKERQDARQGRERLVVICGSEDTVVRAEHVKEDLDGMMGTDGYVFETVKGGHGFLLHRDACYSVVETLARDWRL